MSNTNGRVLILFSLAMSSSKQVSLLHLTSHLLKFSEGIQNAASFFAKASHKGPVGQFLIESLFSSGPQSEQLWATQGHGKVDKDNVVFRNEQFLIFPILLIQCSSSY